MHQTAALPFLTAESSLSRYLDEIRRFPMLEPHEEFMLAKSWREHGDRAAAVLRLLALGQTCLLARAFVHQPILPLAGIAVVAH